MKREIAAMVEELPLKEQAIIKMIYWEDLTLVQVAKKMRMYRSSIERWHKKALEKLKEKILNTMNSANVA